MDIYYGMSEDIGWRSRMENFHAVRKIPEINFFSAEVYDGHINPFAAREAARILTPTFLKRCAEDATLPAERQQPKYEHIKHAYLLTDTFIVNKGILSGAAAATLYIEGERFWAANAGDVRIVMGISAGARTLTVDHKPDLPQEKERIEALGGRVVFLDVPRVEGDLAISRALGDAHLKPFVIPEPRIAGGFLGKENDFAIVACDGIWVVLNGDEVLKIAREAESPQRAAELILWKALERGSEDNITVIVVDMRKYTDSLPRNEMKIDIVIDTAFAKSPGTSLLPGDQTDSQRTS